MIVSIHQPEHLPWLGFIAKLYQSDKFVLLDTVQYRKGYFQNRNKIRDENTWKWITVPIKKSKLNTLIKDIQIDNSSPWREKNIALIENSYKNCPFFNESKNALFEIYTSPYIFLSKLNIALIRHVVKLLKINVDLLIASELNLSYVKGGSQVVYNICKALNADTYLSGAHGRNYLEEKQFAKSGIKVIYQNFIQPKYNQIHGSFIDSLSMIDALFNCGSVETMELIKKSIG